MSTENVQAVNSGSFSPTEMNRLPAENLPASRVLAFSDGIDHAQNQSSAQTDSAKRYQGGLLAFSHDIDQVAEQGVTPQPPASNEAAVSVIQAMGILPKLFPNNGAFAGTMATALQAADAMSGRKDGWVTPQEFNAALRAVAAKLPPGMAQKLEVTYRQLAGTATGPVARQPASAPVAAPPPVRSAPVQPSPTQPSVPAQPAPAPSQGVTASAQPPAANVTPVATEAGQQPATPVVAQARLPGQTTTGVPLEQPQPVATAAPEQPTAPAVPAQAPGPAAAGPQMTTVQIGGADDVATIYDFAKQQLADAGQDTSHANVAKLAKIYMAMNENVDPRRMHNTEIKVFASLDGIEMKDSLPQHVTDRWNAHLNSQAPLAKGQAVNITELVNISTPVTAAPQPEAPAAPVNPPASEASVSEAPAPLATEQGHLRAGNLQSEGIPDQPAVTEAVDQSGEQPVPVEAVNIPAQSAPRPEPEVEQEFSDDAESAAEQSDTIQPIPEIPLSNELVMAVLPDKVGTYEQNLKSMSREEAESARQGIEQEAYDIVQRWADSYDKVALMGDENDFAQKALYTLVSQHKAAGPEQLQAFMQAFNALDGYQLEVSENTEQGTLDYHLSTPNGTVEFALTPELKDEYKNSVVAVEQQLDEVGVWHRNSSQQVSF